MCTKSIAVLHNVLSKNMDDKTNSPHEMHTLMNSGGFLS